MAFEDAFLVGYQLLPLERESPTPFGRLGEALGQNGCENVSSIELEKAKKTIDHPLKRDPVECPVVQAKSSHARWWLSKKVFVFFRRLLLVNTKRA